MTILNIPFKSLSNIFISYFSLFPYFVLHRMPSSTANLHGQSRRKQALLPCVVQCMCTDCRRGCYRLWNTARSWTCKLLMVHCECRTIPLGKGMQILAYSWKNSEAINPALRTEGWSLRDCVRVSGGGGGGYIIYQSPATVLACPVLLKASSCFI